MLLIALFGLGRLMSGGNAAGTWRNANVACLPSGHQNVAFHIHPQLEITVDGERQTIPPNAGVSSACMAEVHTHDSSGKLHVESARASREGTHTLEDFFAVWDRDIERDGYTLTASVDGNEVDNPEEITLRDEVKITLSYISESESGTSTNATTSTTTSTQ